MSASATPNDATLGKISAGLGAGTSPPTPVVLSGSNDFRGTVTFGSGTLPTSNIVLVINFSVAMSTVPNVIISTTNGTVATIELVVSSVGSGGFSVAAPIMPASQANTAYSISYIVIG
jgi:hypothetical protein